MRNSAPSAAHYSDHSSSNRWSSVAAPSTEQLDGLGPPLVRELLPPQGPTRQRRECGTLGSEQRDAVLVRRPPRGLGLLQRDVIAALTQRGECPDAAQLGPADHVPSDLRQPGGAVELGERQLGVAPIDPQLGPATEASAISQARPPTPHGAPPG